MTTSWLPWIVMPRLTQERLLIVGDLIRVAREEALLEHRPDKCESNWSLGVRQFERTNGAITAATQQYPWLTVVAGAGGGPVEFVFAIGDHPIRVCRGDHDDVPIRFQEPCFPELQQQQLLAALDAAPAQQRTLRVVVENDPTGVPADIYLVEIDDETRVPIRCYWIPRITSAAVITPFITLVTPVVIPPVMAEAVDDDTAQAESENADLKDDKKTGSDD